MSWSAYYTKARIAETRPSILSVCWTSGQHRISTARDECRVHASETRSRRNAVGEHLTTASLKPTIILTCVVYCGGKHLALLLTVIRRRPVKLIDESLGVKRWLRRAIRLLGERPCPGCDFRSTWKLQVGHAFGLFGGTGSNVVVASLLIPGLSKSCALEVKEVQETLVRLTRLGKNRGHGSRVVGWC